MFRCWQHWSNEYSYSPVIHLVRRKDLGDGDKTSVQPENDSGTFDHSIDHTHIVPEAYIAFTLQCIPFIQQILWELLKYSFGKKIQSKVDYSFEKAFELCFCTQRHGNQKRNGKHSYSHRSRSGCPRGGTSESMHYKGSDSWMRGI